MTKDARKEFDYTEWAARFRSLVDADAHARQSWRTLTEAGVDSRKLSSLLALSCDFSGNPATRQIDLMRTDLLRKARNKLLLAARLEADRKALCDLGSALPDGLLESLDQSVNQLRGSAKETRQLFSKHQMNTTFFLVILDHLDRTENRESTI